MIAFKRHRAKPKGCKQTYASETVEVEGWYLFGFIPLYVRETQ